MNFEPEFLSPRQGAATSIAGGFCEKEPIAPLNSAAQAPPGPSMYNFVKAVAKDSAAPEAAERISERLRLRPEDALSQNSKKSTGLHACGYLKRWDMAMALLAAGADPEAKNDAGHSFFLTAANDPQAPVDILFSGHPHLLEKHRKFESKGLKRNRAKMPASEKDQPKDAPVQQGAAKCGPARPSAPAPANAWNVYVERQDWSQEPPPAQDFSRASMPTERAALFVESIPEELLAKLLERGLGLAPAAQGQALLRLCQSEAGRACPEDWAQGCREAPVADQREAMALLATAGAERSVHLLAQAGMAIDDELVELCEERQWHELADLLIDLQSMRKLMAPSASALRAGAPRQGKQAQWQERKPASAKRKSPGAAGSGRGQPQLGARSRKLGLIANLDAPVREASDFEYAERKPSAKAPLVIVKKYRRPATGGPVGG